MPDSCCVWLLCNPSRHERSANDGKRGVSGVMQVERAGLTPVQFLRSFAVRALLSAPLVGESTDGRGALSSLEVHFYDAISGMILSWA